MLLVVVLLFSVKILLLSLTKCRGATYFTYGILFLWDVYTADGVSWLVKDTIRTGKV